MNTLPSIRTRLSRTLIGMSMAWGIAVSAVVALSVDREVGELLDETLQESAEILFGLLSFNAAQLPLGGGGAMPAPVHDEQLVWQIVSAQQQVLLRSHRAPTNALVPRLVKGFESVGAEWRVYAMPFDGLGRTLYVAQRGSARREARLEAALFTVAGALLVGLVCAAMLNLRIRKELDPVAALSLSIARYDPLDAHSHLADATRSELVPMHDAINDLGARLGKRLTNERAFSAHAAHALRTPLAGLVAQLAVAQRESPPESQPRLKNAREAADRLRRVVAALLTLFRTGGDVKWQPVDIVQLLAHLPVDRLTVVAQDAIIVFADPDLLAAAFLNLLDNSQNHGASTVAVSAYVQSDRVHINFADNGFGIPEPKRQRLQASLDGQDYEEQAGLGLMLADLIARAHGGQLRLVAADAGCTIDFVIARSAESPNTIR